MCMQRLKRRYVAYMQVIVYTTLCMCMQRLKCCYVEYRLLYNWTIALPFSNLLSLASFCGQASADQLAYQVSQKVYELAGGIGNPPTLT